MFEIKSEPVSFLVYLKPECRDRMSGWRMGQGDGDKLTWPRNVSAIGGIFPVTSLRDALCCPSQYRYNRLGYTETFGGQKVKMKISQNFFFFN